MDDMPGMIDTVDDSKAKTSKVVFDFNKKDTEGEENFKMILSKKKRREKNKAEALASAAASTSMGEDIELDEDSEEDLIDGDGDEENPLSLAAFDKKSNDLTTSQKFKFPPLTGEKMNVSCF